jgi:hypothetical protein
MEQAMLLVYTLLIAVSVAVLAGVVVAIYASAMIARPLPERMDRTTMLLGNEPTQPRTNPGPASMRHALHRPQV